MIRTFSLFKHLIGLTLCAVLLLLVAAPASAQHSIIVNKASAQKASKDEARDMFAGAKLTWSDGAKVQVVDQAESEAGKAFYEKVIGKSVNQVRMQWTKLLLSGQAMAPKKCVDDAAVKKAVAEGPNTIGYISTSALDETVKELLRIE